MTKSALARLIPAAICILAAPASAAAAGEAAPGKYALVLGAKAAEPEKFAAEFLAERLRRDLGAEASVGTERPAGEGKTVFVLGTPGSNPALARFKAELPKDAAEGFLIATDAGATCLVGASPRAVVYAASRLMQERGWRFYSLHEIGEVPLERRGEWPKDTIKDAPALKVRALVTDSLGDALPRYLDWMATNGLNRVRVRIDRVSPETAVPAWKEAHRRGILFELTAPASWWSARAGLKGDEPVENANARLKEQMKDVAARLPAASEVAVLRSGEQVLGGRFGDPHACLDAVRARVGRAAGDEDVGVELAASPRRFLFDDQALAANYFAASAWKGAQPVEAFVKDYCTRYYGKGASGDDVAAHFLGIEAMGPALARPDALLDDAVYTQWRALVEKFRGARTKARADTPPRKRIALHYRAVLDHQQTCADAARMIRQAAAAEGEGKRRLLLDAVKLCWDYNRRKGPRLFDMNPNDAFAFRDAFGKMPELEGELALIEKARALLLAGEDGRLPPGLVAAARAGGGAKFTASELAAEGADAGGFADGKADTAAVLAAGPGGRFVVDFGAEVFVARVRFLGTADRPVTEWRLVGVDASGGTATLVHARAGAPEMFLVQEATFPPCKVRKLVFEACGYALARPEASGPALAELEAYEK